VSTANAFAIFAATPVFAESGLPTLNIDPESVASLVSGCTRQRSALDARITPVSAPGRHDVERQCLCLTGTRDHTDPLADAPGIVR